MWATNDGDTEEADTEDLNTELGIEGSKDAPEDNEDKGDGEGSSGDDPCKRTDDGLEGVEKEDN